MKNPYIELIEMRRTHYSISSDLPISDEVLKETIAACVKHVPSAFNSQTGRVVLLLNEQHHKLWNIVRAELHKIVPIEKFAPTEEKIRSFDAGHGTILFFEAQEPIQALQQKFPTYKENFPIWSLNATGMLQYSIWLALSDMGVGASLQHYNPLIDDEVKKSWNIPDSWKLWAQMPFGNIVAPPNEKSFEPIEKKFIIWE